MAYTKVNIAGLHRPAIDNQQSFLEFLDEQQIEPTLEALSPQLVRMWQQWLRSRSTGRRGGLVTEKQGVMSLKTWAHFLWENDVYAFDPLARLKTPRVQKIHRKPFTQEEAQRLVQTATAGPNPIRDRALLLVFLDTGCRVGELCAAHVDDVDLSRGSILFRRTKNGRPREVVFRVANSRDGGPCLIALRNWIKIREALPGVEALFTTRERYPLSTRRVREIFAELGKQARVPDCHPHRARHTAASEFLAERPGAEIQLRHRLGQVSPEVLSDYVSISDRTAEEMAVSASLSTRWNLGSGTQPRVSRSTVNAAKAMPQQRQHAEPADPIDTLLARVKTDASLRQALLAALLGQQGVA